MRFQFRQIEREGEPPPVERMSDDRTAAPVAMPRNQSFICEKVERMADGDAADTKLLHQSVERRQTIAWLPLPARNTAPQHRRDPPIGGDAEPPRTLSGVQALSPLLLF